MLEYNRVNKEVNEMIFKTVEIESDRTIDVDTEIKFSIATARVEQIELLRFDVRKDSDLFSKIYNASIKVLRKMKNQGNIQFIATPKSFTDENAEAEFLINKYPDQISNVTKYGDGEAYIFVKL